MAHATGVHFRGISNALYVELTALAHTLVGRWRDVNGGSVEGGGGVVLMESVRGVGVGDGVVGVLNDLYVELTVLANSVDGR